MISEKQVGIHEQIIEIHRIGACQPALIFHIYIASAGKSRLVVTSHDIPVLPVSLWQYETVLRHGDSRSDSGRLVFLLVKSHALDNAFYKRPGIRLIIYGVV